MIIKSAKPASGLAIRKAFHYAATEMLGEKRYISSHEIRRGVCLDFSRNSDWPTLTYPEGDSVRINNARGKTVRISLVPLTDGVSYEEFAILAEDVEREFVFDLLADFKNELNQLSLLMINRLSMWPKKESSDAEY